MDGLADKSNSYTKSLGFRTPDFQARTRISCYTILKLGQLMKIILYIFLLAVSLSAHGENIIQRSFEKNKVEGTMLIESLDGSRRYSYNLSDNQHIPASTFKIANTLILLEEDLLSPDKVIKWDKEVRVYEPWNQDQTLRTAFQFSCVWCYQRFAEKLTNATYLSYLEKFDYGNKKTGHSIKTFWLEGDLRVSVKEQIEFLKKVYLKKLPIKKENFTILEAVMISEEKSSYQVYSKTGWAGTNGWFVGYIKTSDNDAWFFANHLKIKSNEMLSLRKSMVYDVFYEMGVLK